MSKEPTRQANFRLPEQLLDDLKLVSETTGDSQTEIIKKAVEPKIERLKIKHNLNEKETAAAR